MGCIQRTWLRWTQRRELKKKEEVGPKDYLLGRKEEETKGPLSKSRPPEGVCLKKWLDGKSCLCFHKQYLNSDLKPAECLWRHWSLDQDFEFIRKRRAGGTRKTAGGCRVVKQRERSCHSRVQKALGHEPTAWLQTIPSLKNRSLWEEQSEVLRLTP